MNWGLNVVLRDFVQVLPVIFWPPFVFETDRLTELRRKAIHAIEAVLLRRIVLHPVPEAQRDGGVVQRTAEDRLHALNLAVLVVLEPEL